MVADTCVFSAARWRSQATCQYRMHG